MMKYFTIHLFTQDVKEFILLNKEYDFVLKEVLSIALSELLC